MIERFALSDTHDACRIINGGWQLSAGHRQEELDRPAIVAGLVRLAQAGLTSFDCADIYTGVEELFGEVRSRYVAEGGAATDLQIHTKFVPDRAALRQVDKAYVTGIINRSLARLGVERLDLVQFHWWDYAVPGAVETAGHLLDLQQAGKIRSLGVTNFNGGELGNLIDAGVPIVSAQVQYSLLDRRPERTMVKLCRDHGVKLLCYGSLAGGFLTDRYLDAPDPAEASNRSLTKYRLVIEEYGGWDDFQALLRRMREIANRHGVSVANVSARYVLQREQVGAVIIGARDDRHLADTVRAFSFQLTEDELIELQPDDAIRVPGDCFDLERVPDGRHQRIMKMNLNEA